VFLENDENRSVAGKRVKKLEELRFPGDAFVAFVDRKWRFSANGRLANA
jgi:hypothetical protein